MYKIWTKNWWESASWEAQKRRTRRFLLNQLKSSSRLWETCFFNTFVSHLCFSSTSRYALLEVDSSVKAEDLRLAYRRAIRKAHPDKGGSSEAFLAVCRAFETWPPPVHRSPAYTVGLTAKKHKKLGGVFFFFGGGGGFWGKRLKQQNLGWGVSDTFCWLRVQKEIVWKVGVIWCNTFLRFFVEHRPCDPKAIPLVRCFLSAAAHRGCTLKCSHSTFLRSGTDQYVQEAWARSANLSETIKGISLAGDHPYFIFADVFCISCFWQQAIHYFNKTAHDTAVRPNTVKKKQLISDKKDVSMQLSNEFQWKV